MPIIVQMESGEYFCPEPTGEIPWSKIEEKLPNLVEVIRVRLANEITSEIGPHYRDLAAFLDEMGYCG